MLMGRAITLPLVPQFPYPTLRWCPRRRNIISPRKLAAATHIQLLLNQLTKLFASTPRIERPPPRLRPPLLLTDGSRDVLFMGETGTITMLRPCREILQANRDAKLFVRSREEVMKARPRHECSLSPGVASSLHTWRLSSGRLAGASSPGSRPLSSCWSNGAPVAKPRQFRLGKPTPRVESGRSDHRVAYNGQNNWPIAVPLLRAAAYRERSFLFELQAEPAG